MRAGRPEVAIQFHREADLAALKPVRILRGGMPDAYANTLTCDPLVSPRAVGRLV
jgi:hypothetical protein